jgi:hypothetical protein
MPSNIFNEYSALMDFNLLSDVTTFENASEEILISAVASQISNRTMIKPTVDFLKLLDDRIRFLKLLHLKQDTPSEVDDFQQLEINMYDNILEVMKKELGIHDNLDSITFNNKKMIIKELYRFFVFDYYRNLVHMFFMYVYENKKLILSKYKNNLDKKDLEVLSLKLNNENSENMIIGYNIENILNDMINECEKTPLKIIEYITKYDPEEITNSLITTYFLTDNLFVNIDINDDFTDKFFKPLSISNKEILINKLKIDFLKLNNNK